MKDDSDGLAAPLVAIMRGPIVESLHRGHGAIVDGDGRMLASVGDARYLTVLRSAAKPLQALPLLTHGVGERYSMSERELAVICASHFGEPEHVATVTGLLERLGLTEADLRCGAHWPTSPEATRQLVAAGQQPSQTHNNCSGKHTGMLASCLARGFPLDTYLEPEHPLQQEILRVIALFTGAPVTEMTRPIDGCSAPTYALPLSGLARAYARLIDPASAPDGYGEACQLVTNAMRRRPTLVGGSVGSFATDLMRVAGDRLFGKNGAEAVFCVGVAPGALPGRAGGIGIAVKIEDGGERAVPPTVLAILRQLGVLSAEQYQALRAYAEPVITNHRGLPTGAIRALVALPTGGPTAA